jgi:hypothetical protein
VTRPGAPSPLVRGPRSGDPPGRAPWPRRWPGGAGEILPALRVGVGTEPAELAHRLSTTATDPAVPAMVTDPTGRAVGAVTLPRLLAALARQGARD